MFIFYKKVYFAGRIFTSVKNMRNIFRHLSFEWEIDNESGKESEEEFAYVYLKVRETDL